MYRYKYKKDEGTEQKNNKIRVMKSILNKENNVDTE